MPFNSLPPELVVQVLSFVLPEDLVSFALVCHQIYDNAGSCLAKHKAFRAQYSSIFVQLNEPADILLQFSKDPWRSSYPRHIVFRCSQRQRGEDTVWTGDQARNRLDRLREIASECQYKLTESVNHLSPNDINRVHDATMALSFWLFPNLESVKIASEIQLQRGFSITTALLAQDARAIDGTRVQALEKLSKFTLGNKIIAGYRIIEFAAFVSFMALPGIKTFECNNIHTNGRMSGQY